MVLLAMLGMAAATQVPTVQGAPETDAGVEVRETQFVDLDAGTDARSARRLRMRLMTIAPGGQTRANGPMPGATVFYVLSGETTVFYGDGTVQPIGAGSMGRASPGVVHWYRNHRRQPAVLLAVDIVQMSGKAAVRRRAVTRPIW